MSSNTLFQLQELIAERRREVGSKSYTRQLLEGGPEKCAKKFGEEAVELVIAGVGTDRAHITAEAADVLYHMLVLLQVRDVPLEDVLAVLAGRMGTSGLDEKAARAKG